MAGAPHDGAAPPPGCRGWGLGQQAAATPRPGSLAGQRQGDRDTPRREGARERPWEEARTGGAKDGRRSRPAPHAVWGPENAVPPQPGSPGPGAGWMTHGPGSPPSPSAGPTGGLAGLTVPRRPHTAPLFRGPVRRRVWRWAQDGGKGAQPQLSCPSWAALTDRTGDRRGWGRAVSIQPRCHPPKASGPGGCCALAPLSEPLSQPQLGGNSQRQLGSVSGSRPSPRWCSATTTDGSHAFPDRLP